MHELVTRDFVGLEREVERFGEPALRAACRSCAAARRCSTPRPEAAELRAVLDLLPSERGGPGHLRPRPHARARLLHRRGVRGLRRRRSARRSAAAGATTTCSGASAGRCRPAAGRSTSSACTSRAWARGTMSGLGGCGWPCRAARCWGRRSTCSTASASTPPRSAATTAGCSSRTPGSSRCAPATCRPTSRPGAADIGITGKDVLAEQSERDVYELLDLGFGPCRMVFATVDGDDPAAEALRRLGVMRIATKYPKIALAYFERTGRQVGDRRGQGLGRARAADRARRGHRRPHRDRHDPARERARDPRGDLRLDRAADRQPGRPQAQGAGRSTRSWSASVRG